jgi:twitching motility protein PilJ
MRDSRDHSALKGFSITYLALLGALVLSVVLMGVTFVLLERQDARNETQLKLAGEQRLLSRSIVTEALGAARGKEAAFAKLKQSRDRFEQILNDQKSGSETLNLPPPPAELKPFLEDLSNRWSPVKNESDIILAGRESVISVSNFHAFAGKLPDSDEHLVRRDRQEHGQQPRRSSAGLSGHQPTAT